MRSRAVAAETPRASRLDLDPSPGPDDRTTHTKKTTRSLARVPRRIAADHRASIVSLAAIPIACIVDRSPPRGERKTPDAMLRANDPNSNAPIVLPDTDARIRRAEIDPDRGTFSLTHDDSRCAFVSRSREMSSRPSGRGRFASKEAFRRRVGGCATSHHSSMDGRVPARVCVSCVLWMI